MEPGNFCRLIGVNARNMLLECFIEMRNVEQALGDIAKELHIPRATVYFAAKELMEQQYIVPTRRISNTQLYKLNKDLPETKLLIQLYNKANKLQKVVVG